MGEIITQEVPYIGKGALLHKKVLYTGMGKKTVEKVLWTNPSPTSNFSAQTVTLSDSLSNYKYVGINFAYATSYSTGDCNSTIILSVEDFRKDGYNTGVRRNSVAMSVLNISDTLFHRAVMYAGDTSVRFGTCYQNATTTQSNGNSIPLQIIGIKEVYGNSFRKANIYSAVQDIIYYSTDGEIWNVLGQTDSNGYLENADVPEGPFILKSSIAKDPNNLSNPYTKAFNTDAQTLYFMPNDNVLYWWGYESSNLEDCTVANGWGVASYTLDTPVHNTNSISLSTSASMHRSGISSKNAVNCSKVKTIYSGVTAYSTYGYVQIFLLNNKAFNYTGGAAQGNSSAMALLEHTHTVESGNYYPIASSANTQKSTIYALWYEGYENKNNQDVLLTSNDLTRQSRSDNTGVPFDSETRVCFPHEVGFNSDGIIFTIKPIDSTYWDICFYEYQNDVYLGDSAANSWVSFNKNTYHYTPVNSNANKVGFALRKSNNSTCNTNEIEYVDIHKL